MVYIQMSNAGRVCGVWDHEPSTDERLAAYGAYLGKTLDTDGDRASIGFNTWVETHEVMTGGAGR